MSNDNPVCRKCGVEFVPEKVEFEYLGHNFSANIPKCPKCGMVFVTKELAEGKMQEVESLLEEK